jgi:hypothetical protein
MGEFWEALGTPARGVFCWAVVSSIQNESVVNFRGEINPLMLLGVLSVPISKLRFQLV